MPQVKGTANWLTNVRQDLPTYGVRSDHSSEHILNEQMDESLKTYLNNLNKQRHRILADRKFDIKQARDENNRMQQMRSLTRSTSGIRLLQTPSVHSQQDTKSDNINNSKGNSDDDSNTDDNLSDDDSDSGEEIKPRRTESNVKTVVFPMSAINPPRARPSSGFSKPRRQSVAVVRQPMSTKLILPSTRRPMTRAASRARSRRELMRDGAGCSNLMFRPDTGNETGLRRPKTSLGISRGGDNAQYCEVKSFEELKELTVLDQFTDYDKDTIRNEVMKYKQAQHRKADSTLHKKIKVFYTDVDNLVKRTKDCNTGNLLFQPMFKDQRLVFRRKSLALF